MFEWEESTFLGLKALYQRLVKRPQERRAASVRANLKDHRQRLFLLAQMAAGEPVALFETAEAVLCDDERIFLPPEFSQAATHEANIAFYELKTLIGGLVLRHRWYRNCDTPLADRLPELAEDFPRLPALLESTISTFESPDSFWSSIGKIRPPSGDESDASTTLSEGSDERDESDLPDDATTEIQGKGQLDVTVEPEREDDGSGSELPIHTFEKAETLEEHTGLSRKNDDEDELEDHEEALNQLNMTHVLRSRDRPSSIYRADVLLESLAFEADDLSAKGGIPYPEWDHRRHRYREDWCRVFESTAAAASSDWVTESLQEHQALIVSLKKKLAHLANDYLRTKRQPSGEELDIDAVVDYQVGWLAGQNPDENIYLHRKRELHDVAALVLLDRSYSTDGYVDGLRVLDIIRETMLCTGEVLSEFIDSFAVAAFSSDTRHRCSVDWIKTFDDPWAQSRSRLGDLRADGYTRIGPALRHAHETLANQKASRKVVILITDGRPCDYDRYEGTYGIRDVKRAIATGDTHGIITHAFAIETRARETFPAMFTQDHYHIVPNPDALTTSLCDLFAKLKSR